MSSDQCALVLVAISFWTSCGCAPGTCASLPLIAQSGAESRLSRSGLLAQRHRCPIQYLSQVRTVPVLTIAHDKSRPDGNEHQAAVLVPPADPSDRQVRRGPRTTTWPDRIVPRAPPNSCTKLSRASIADARGQGWLVRQVPSISRAAMPETRRCGPSAHHMGPSPSHTCVGVQVKVCPAATMAVAKASIVIAGYCTLRMMQRIRPTTVMFLRSRPDQLG